MTLNKLSISYDQDYALWLGQTIELLKAGWYEQLDIKNLVDELEGMSRRDKREMLSRLKVLLMHLLKWKFQEDKRSKSWKITIRNNREEIAQIMQDSPSLKGYPATILYEAYESARLNAADETELPLDIFPKECPFLIDEVLNPGFWPEN